MKRKSIKNRILTVSALLLALILSLQCFGNLFLSSVSLEQTPECGLQEHLHSQSCYENGKLKCGLASHLHNRNCYLVLLRDNDINRLLTQVATGEGSLELLIDRTVDTALVYDGIGVPEGEDAPASSEQVQAPSVSELDIAALNDTMEENALTGVVLNESLYKASTASAPTDTAVYAASGNSGISTLALGAEESDSDYASNYYVNLDGTWQCVGTLNMSVARGTNRRYYARVSTQSILNLINNSMGSTLSAADVGFTHATSLSPSSWTTATRSGNYTYLGDNYSQSRTARQARYVRLMDNTGATLRFYTVTCIYADDTVETKYVIEGQPFVLPSGADWVDGDGNAYLGGDVVLIGGTTTFTEKQDDGKFRITYDVAFPTVSGTTVSVQPTLLGTALQTVTDIIDAGSGARIRNVSHQEVAAKVNGNAAQLSRVIRFAGWQVSGTDTVISANANLTWEELISYAPTGRLKLTAVWEYRNVQTASFYIRYDSVAVDTNGNITSQDTNLYTPELFATHVGGEDSRTMGYSELNAKYYIADTSADNSYGADSAIRARYGEQEGIWLQSFPNDDAIFEKLKNYTANLRVDGEAVRAEDLHSNAYTIRWYVMKCQDDAWHIDGRLVKKEGILRITKTFAGNADGIALAKQNFYITASNEDADNNHTLTLMNYESHDAESDTYEWEITGVEYGEPWTVTEHTFGTHQAQETTYDSYCAFTVVDALKPTNNQVGADEDGDGVLPVHITGQTYATDAGDVKVLTVNYTNVYHSADSIIIKKEDAKTGSAIGGATFRLLQGDDVNEENNVLHFTYNAAKNQFIYDPSGAVTELAGSASGYYEIVTTGFSYDNGEITVQELQAPVGYTPIENVVVGKQTDGTVGILNPSPMTAYHNGLLIIRNTTDNTSVTARKQWLCPEAEWQDVTVQLLANGTLVSSVVPGVEPSAVLSGSNGWAYTWSSLPTHASGQEIVWSVRETKVGEESCKPDYTFANWIVSYTEPVYTKDSLGRVINTAITVQNDTRRTLLRVFKTSVGGGFRLKGATFTLEHLYGTSQSFTVDPNFVTRTATTGLDGSLTFDNLLYGYYRLTEIEAPSGYELLNDPIFLTITESGTVMVEAHAYAAAGTTAYSVAVSNVPRRPMPTSGGGGIHKIYMLGGGLVLLAVCGYILPRLKKKGGYDTDKEKDK